MATKITSIPVEMKACQIVEFDKPHGIRTIPTPIELRPHEILLQVVVAGLCQTDLEYQKGFFPIDLPITGSHEGAGIVVEVGADMHNRFKEGDRVLAGMTFGRCGKCEICKGPEKYRHYCEKRETMMTVGRNGPWQEYLVVDGREASFIPKEMSFATAAPLACAGATSWHGINLCTLEPGDWMAIIGSGGGLGHLAVQMARAKGFKVLAIDAKDEGLALSSKYGADAVIDARDCREKIEQQASRITGSGSAATLILSDHHTTMDTAAAVTKVSGEIVQIAVIEPVSIHLTDLMFKDLRIRGSFMASQCETQEMLNEVIKHGIRVENNIFHGLEDVSKAVDMLQNGQYRGKASIVVNEAAFKNDESKGRV